MPDEKLKRLLERNLAMTEEIHEMVQKIRKYVLFAQIMGVIKLVLILAPIILAIIYLPPYVQGLMSQYQDIMPTGLNIDQTMVDNLNQYLKALPNARQ